MANRWIEFVKNYAKENNISYTCAMCEINTKNLYKPLKKEANREEEPKIFTIKTKKTNPKQKEEVKPKEDKQLKYNDVLHKLLLFLNSNYIEKIKSFSRHTLKQVNEYINDVIKEKKNSYDPIISKKSIKKKKIQITEELKLPEKKNILNF
jgi:hypothetical protein